MAARSLAVMGRQAASRRALAFGAKQFGNRSMAYKNSLDWVKAGCPSPVAPAGALEVSTAEMAAAYYGQMDAALAPAQAASSACRRRNAKVKTFWLLLQSDETCGAQL